MCQSMLLGNTSISTLPLRAGAQLRRILHEEGAVAVLSSLDHRRYPQEHVADIAGVVADPLKAILELFCLGCTVSKERLPDSLINLLRGFITSGLVRMSGNGYTISPLSLFLVDGLIYLAEIPEPLMSIYIGEDSFALAGRLQLGNAQGIKVLDLCSGPGIQGLLAARNGAVVEAVEINPIAAQVARCNASLNSLEHRYTVHTMSVKEYFSTVSSETVFHRITANPPLVPLPKKYSYNKLGHGGITGLEIFEIILESIPELLAENGTYTTIGMCGGNEDGPLLLDVLDRFLAERELRATACLLSREELSEKSRWLDHATTSLNLYSQGGNRIDKSELLDAYFANDISFLFTYALDMHKTADENRLQDNKLQIVDFSSLGVISDGWWIY